MIRSMLLGLSVAALLQLGASFCASEALIFPDHPVDWVQLQSDAMDRLVEAGFTLIQG
ncbi:hypothetical protein FHS83_002217 [Rhizomicrobium palustre]|uniref:Uncharacterized protein n=1 Tax=Rhizomicrobium palustre TaxID=189966 RepID=A0A846N075_9PROT|nr:hypothetical protein [Rhizomicrobium palustre]NIK88899.1 hypothetical protein [Rhizomicrobium palustre]